MLPERRVLELAEALEQAYRLALSVEESATEPPMKATASTLLGVLDRARASLVCLTTRPRVG